LHKSELRNLHDKIDYKLFQKKLLFFSKFSGIIFMTKTVANQTVPAISRVGRRLIILIFISAGIKPHVSLLVRVRFKLIKTCSYVKKRTSLNLFDDPVSTGGLIKIAQLGLHLFF
jgi:hypothetical protein